MTGHQDRVTVVGGGIIGIAIAMMLQTSGARVTIIDAGEPGRGCSYGNAGVIATSFVLPLSSVRHLLAAPKMLFDPLGPLSIRPRHLVEVAPWLARFALNALPVRQRKTIDGLRSLNSAALPAWRRLLMTVGRTDMLLERGMLEVARDAAGVASLRAAMQRLADEGVALSWHDAAGLSELEPALAGTVMAGMLHTDVAHVTDPFRVSTALVRRFVDAGGSLRCGRVEAVTPTAGGVRVQLAGELLESEKLVIAAGTNSADLLRPFGVRAPICVEYGYHLMLPAPTTLPTRPVSFHAESFLATPMGSALRLAGTVELAGSSAEPDWRRAEQLLTLARRYLPGLSEDGATRWMGGRPSFPDSLPAIGRVSRIPQILYAFGHQHLGLTQAAITAECMRSLAWGIEAPVPMSPFSLERFGP